MESLVYDSGAPQAASALALTKGGYGIRQVSAVNAANVLVVDLFNLAEYLAIDAVASAGTTALTVEVSVDGANWRTVDSIAAAASQVKQYVYSSVGATLAVCPLSYRYVRVTAGAAGGGNTTTLIVAAK
jgi:hypothetical protein